MEDLYGETDNEEKILETQIMVLGNEGVPLLQLNNKEYMDQIARCF
jgi:hypothetical protein